MVDCGTRHRNVVIMTKHVNSSEIGAKHVLALEAMAVGNLALQPRAVVGDYVSVSSL